MKKLNKPPPALDGARLLAYAVIDDSVVHSGKSTLIVDGKPLTAVPRLAICQSLDSNEVLLLFCDERWNSLGVVECSSLAEAKKRAENEYRGVSKKWVKANVTEKQAAQYLEKQHAGQQCSFCGKTPNEVQQLFTASSIGICDNCVRDFYKDLGA